MSAVLEVEGLVKSFPGKDAVQGVSLTLQAGEFYALLGPNGAGKTTTLKLITGLLRPDAGSLRVLGHDVVQAPAAAKRGLAYLPDEPMLYGKLRPLEYLEFVAGLWGLPAAEAKADAERLLVEMELWDSRQQYCETFSRGMQQKLALAGALIHKPQLLILDEPLTGLDALAARQVKDRLAALTREGLTVLFTTHILEVAEKLASRIGFIVGGKVIAEGDLASLKARYAPEATALEDVFIAAARHRP